MLFLTLQNLALIMVLFSVLSSNGFGATKLANELIVRTVENFANRESVVTFFESAKLHQVSVVHLAVKQDEDDEVPSGQVFYASRIAPIAQGYAAFDALAVSIDEAHKRGIKLYAWMPQFHDQAAAITHPDWRMVAQENGEVLTYQGKGRVEHFINPLHPAVQAYEESLVLEVVQRYDVDGIDLDWVRFDGFNMDVGDYTRSIAMSEMKLDPRNLDFTQTLQLDNWNKWRSQKIADYIKQIRQSLTKIKPNMIVGAFILPPYFTDVGQDLALFSQDLDVVMPMAYFNDWGYNPDWVVNNLLSDVTEKIKAANASTVIAPTLDLSGTDAQNKKIVVDIRKQYPLVKSIVWFSPTTWGGDDIQRVTATTDGL